MDHINGFNIFANTLQVKLTADSEKLVHIKKKNWASSFSVVTKQSGVQLGMSRVLLHVVFFYKR